MAKRYLGRLLSPISKHLTRAGAAARVISRTRGVRLLLDARLRPATQLTPAVYPFAAYLARVLGCRRVVAAGRPGAKDLFRLCQQFEIDGLVPAAELESYRRRYGFVKWLEADFEAGRLVLPDEDVLGGAVVVCAGVLERLDHPAPLLRRLKSWLEVAPACVLTDAGRSLEEFERLLRDAGFDPEFVGLTAADDAGYEKSAALAIITNGAVAVPRTVKAPPDFRVVAFMAAYNEEDIIVRSIRKWTEQGVRVHVLENWSTDSTYELAKGLESQLPVTVERFPREGPAQFFEWGAMLERFEALSAEIEADWFVRRGADEILTPPWPGMSYRDGLYLVDRAGFNLVDHTVINFNPVDDGFEAGMDHEAYFRHFEFDKLPHNSRQQKAWKNCGRPIQMAAGAGHDLPFEGQRLYPFKFLLKHYPVRSQRHGERKVFRERKARWNPVERARGWHRQYDSVRNGHRFVREESGQLLFDEEDFNRTFLVERLSGIGVIR
jgi:glycosyltransferase involved in cell wall biosynthesis